MPAINPHIVWIFAVIVGGILLLGGVTSVFNLLSRGWRALAAEFPADAEEVEASTGRTWIYIIAPGDALELNRPGCLHFLMPWRWKLPTPVRHASGVEHLRLTADGGRLGVRGSVSIPWSEIELLGRGEAKMAYTFGGRFGEIATLRAGSCHLVAPVAPFKHEIEMLESLQPEAPAPARSGDGPDAEPDGSGSARSDAWL